MTGLLAALATTSLLWGELEPGPYRVGFEMVETYDYSRPFRSGGENRARPVTMFIWYPADDDASGSQIPFRRYVTNGGRDELALRLNATGAALSRLQIEAILNTPTEAFADANRARGRFPLILFGTGLTAPAYLNTVLCEYLASHGYVSVALPSLPRRENTPLDYDQLAIDTQIRDMEFAIQSLHDYGETDLDRIALVAWSLGGVSQALLQMKNPDINAVVSLDAATGYAYGERLLESSIYFEPSAATAAFFHATESRHTDGPARKSFRYFDTVVRGEAFLLTIEGVSHAEFVSLGGVVANAVAPSEGSTEVLGRYGLLCLYVRHFLAHALREDEESLEFLSVTPARHGFKGLVLSRKR